MSRLGAAPFQVGEWLVEPDLNRIGRGGESVLIEPRTMAVLVYLAARPGEVVGTDDLIAEVWHGRPMGDNPVYKCVAKLRRAMHDDPHQPWLIETIARKGYRLVAEVVPVDAEAGGAGPVAGTFPAPPGRSSPGVQTARARGAKRIAMGAAGGVALVLAVAVAVWRLAPTPSPAPSAADSPAAPVQHLVSTFPGSHSAPSYAPDGRSLAYINDHGGVAQVWIATLPGNDTRQLTFGDRAAARPRWSHDGTRIVFGSQHSIWTVPAAGGTARPIISDAYHANVSDDGKRIVFERNDEIWIADGDGGNQRRVAGIPRPDLLMAYRHPALSPDGRTIAFFQSETSPMGDLWLVPAEGGVARRLTDAPALGGHPAWSPDSRSIVYASQRGGSRTLWRVAVEDGRAEQLLQSSGDDDEPDISRDGSRVAYSSVRERFVLTSTDLGTGKSTEILESRKELVAPVFSPDGNSIAWFGVTAEGNVAIFRMPVEGGLPSTVAGEPGEILVMPQWSADGTRLYHYRSRPAPALAKVAVDGGERRDLVEGWQWGEENGAQVSPDGRVAVYTRIERGRPTATVLRDLGNGTETSFAVVLDRPRWSHDGRWIVGTRAGARNVEPGDILLCGLAGEPCRTLAQGARLPSWSADDRTVYFTRRENGRLALFSVPAAGGIEQRLVDIGPLHGNGQFYDVNARGQVVWVRHEGGRSEVWSMGL